MLFLNKIFRIFCFFPLNIEWKSNSWPKSRRPCLIRPTHTSSFPSPPASCPHLSTPTSEKTSRFQALAQPLALLLVIMLFCSVKHGSLFSALRRNVTTSERPSWDVSVSIFVFAFKAHILIYKDVQMCSFTYLLPVFPHQGEFYSLLSPRGLHSAWHIFFFNKSPIDGLLSGFQIFALITIVRQTPWLIPIPYFCLLPQVSYRVYPFAIRFREKITLFTAPGISPKAYNHILLVPVLLLVIGSCTDMWYSDDQWNVREKLLVASGKSFFILKVRREYIQCLVTLEWQPF